jgi:hypothetical protein
MPTGLDGGDYKRNGGAVARRQAVVHKLFVATIGPVSLRP